MLLEAYYEPQFSGRSHGFRRKRGCHTALREVQNTWTGTGVRLLDRYEYLLIRVKAVHVGRVWLFQAFRALPRVVCAGYRRWRGPAGNASGRVRRCGFRGFRGRFREDDGKSFPGRNPEARR